MMIKYRVHEVAKDLNVPSKEIIDLLQKHFGEVKKHMTALTEEELDVIFEHYTQLKAVPNFDAYFAENKTVAEDQAAQAAALEREAVPVQEEKPKSRRSLPRRRKPRQNPYRTLPDSRYRASPSARPSCPERSPQWVPSPRIKPSPSRRRCKSPSKSQRPPARMPGSPSRVRRLRTGITPTVWFVPRAE